MIELTSWRTTFIALGAPQLIVALAFHLTVPSARPLSTERDVATNLYADTTRLLRLRTLQALFCASFFSTINGAMDKFLPSFYVRVHEMGIAEVGTWLGIGTGIVAGSGGLIGGRVIDAAYRRKQDPSVSRCRMLLSDPSKPRATTKMPIDTDLATGCCSGRTARGAVGCDVSDRFRALQFACIASTCRRHQRKLRGWCKQCEDGRCATTFAQYYCCLARAAVLLWREHWARRRG
jgi:hypothetical protein